MAQSQKVIDALNSAKSFKAAKPEKVKKAVATAVEFSVPDFVLSYDTETTGIPNWKIPSDSPEQPHLVSLAATLYNVKTREAVSTMDVIIKPNGWVIPQETIDIHGITQEQAEKEGIPEHEALEMLVKLCGDHRRVAYNKTFDQRIVRIGLKRYSDEATIEKWHTKDDHDCAMRMAQKDMGRKSVKLVDAYEHYTGEVMEGNHNALADVKGCFEVYMGVINSNAMPK